MPDPTKPVVTQAEEPEYLEAEPIPPPPVDPGRGVGAPAPGDLRRAWAVALVADALQFFLLPMVGATAGFMVGIDLLVAFLLVRWMGWHVAFLPAFITELVPIANVVPSWTLAMLIVTRLRDKRLP
jgi:hypothetical protein